jgi:hypothetical protein
MTEMQPNSRPDTDAPTLRDDAWYFAEFLRDRDAFCPLCRSNLRGLTELKCPNCGIELRLSVGLTDPFLAGWLTAQVVLLIAAGVGMFFVVIWGIQGLSWPGGLGVLTFVTPFYFIATIPAAFGLLYWRRRFMQLRRVTQWSVAVILILINMSALLLLYHLL